MECCETASTYGSDLCFCQMRCRRLADEARAMDGIMVRVEHPILCKVATLLVVKRL